jgi:hypothetical protein
MQRLTYLESRLISEGRAIVIFEDVHFESTEARIDRCLAEVGRSPKDMIVILRDFSNPDEIRPHQPRNHPHWRVDQLHRRSPTIQPHSVAFYGPQKGLVMLSRIRGSAALTAR